MNEKEYDLYKRILNLSKIAIVAMAMIYGVRRRRLIEGGHITRTTNKSKRESEIHLGNKRAKRPANPIPGATCNGEG